MTELMVTVGAVVNKGCNCSTDSGLVIASLLGCGQHILSIYIRK